MRAMKKIVMGASVSALALAMAGGVNVNAAMGASSITATKQITGMSTSGETYVSYDYIKDKKGTLSVNPKAKWDVYEKLATADLSSLKTTKTQYVTVDDGSSDGGKTTYIFAENKDKYSGKCDGKTITLKKGTEALKDADLLSGSNAVFEYRTEAGEWIDYKLADFSLAPFEQQGATLYFRTKGDGKAVENTKTTVTDASEKDTYFDVAATVLAGKEFKVKIPKKSNGPSIKVDYKTNTVKALKNAQMRALTADTNNINVTTVTTWADAAVYPIDSAKFGVFEAKTVKDNKADSKVSIYKWSKVAAPTAVNNSAKIGNTDKDVAKSPETGNPVDLKIASVSENVIEFENASKETYLVYITDSAATAAPALSVKANLTLKSKATGKLKLAGNVKDGAKVWVAYAGDPKTAKLTSALVSVGTLEFKPVATETK